MKNKLLALVIVFVFSGSIFAYSQGTGSSEMSISLKEAQDYAVQNNKVVMTSRLDVQATRIAQWETISSGLLQVNTNGSFTDNLKLMTTLLPGDFFGKPGEYVPIRFGQQFNSNASIQATLLLFNAPYIVGIETTKLANKLSERSLSKSEQDIRESVSMTYYLILIAERSIGIIEKNISNLNEILKATRAMLAAGMAEQTDVDQMISNVTMVENSRISLARTIEVNYNMLRFLLGVDAGTTIKLSESLETITSGINVDALLSQQFEISKNLTYQLMEGQEKLSSLMLKSQKASILPSLSGFYSYGTNGMGNKLNEIRWFPNSMTGLQVSVPIFGSGQKYASIKRAQINLEKSKTTKALVSDQLLLQEKQYRYNLINANLQYRSQKDNIEVSKRVYTSTENKFKQGMASSLELTQANSLYLAAENNYVTALMNLLQTKLALDKLLNNI